VPVSHLGEYLIAYALNSRESTFGRVTISQQLNGPSAWLTAYS
jgi:hypothetical protein